MAKTQVGKHGVGRWDHYTLSARLPDSSTKLHLGYLLSFSDNVPLRLPEVDPTVGGF